MINLLDPTKERRKREVWERFGGSRGKVILSGRGGKKKFGFKVIGLGKRGFEGKRSGDGKNHVWAATHRRGKETNL